MNDLPQLDKQPCHKSASAVISHPHAPAPILPAQEAGGNDDALPELRMGGGNDDLR